VPNSWPESWVLALERRWPACRRHWRCGDVLADLDFLPGSSGRVDRARNSEGAEGLSPKWSMWLVHHPARAG